MTWAIYLDRILPIQIVVLAGATVASSVLTDPLTTTACALATFYSATLAAWEAAT